jgi:Tetratricopeptide repeat
MLVLQVATRLYASGALLPARVARARGLAPMPPAPPPDAASTVLPALGPTLRLGSEDSPPAPDEMPTPPPLPELPAWDAPTSGGEMERAMRSVPLGLEPPTPAAPRAPPTPPPARDTAPTSRSLTPSAVFRVPLHRPPTPPSVPVALEAGEESPLAVAARAVAAAVSAPEPPARFSSWLPLVGVAALAVGFLVGSVWIRLVHAPRPSAARALSTPAGVSGWLELARARFDAGDGTGAEEAANQAASLDGNDPRPHLLLANFHLRRGRSEHARAALRRVLELEPSGPRADEARALLATIP